MRSRLNRSFAMRYYFNVKDGKVMLDENGVDLADMQAVKREALLASTELLSGVNDASFWNGEPWKLWVTDEPNGAGKTVLTLSFTAEVFEAHQSSRLDTANDHLTDAS